MHWALNLIEDHPLVFGAAMAWAGFVLATATCIDAKRKLRFRTKFHGRVDAKTQPVLFRRYLRYCIVLTTLFGVVAVMLSCLALA
jgi:hypothetical protein